jgi:tRNA pseudouridine38-40 synthase
LTDGTKAVTVRLRFVVEYDGTDFVGWQRQVRGRTVQGELERCIAEITNQREARVVGAGRTDSGVHAVGQVAHVDTVWSDEPAALARAMNAVLPRDVAVRSCTVAPRGFHARHSAVGRGYRYTIWRGSGRSPLMRRTSHFVQFELEVAPMVEASEHLVGAHDFGAFGNPTVSGGSTVRRLDQLDVREEGDRLVFDVAANAFLRHQVRRTVGFLIDVGRGRYPASSVGHMLAREIGAPVARRAPARGLMLMAVDYPPDEMMAHPYRGEPARGSKQ